MLVEPRHCFGCSVKHRLSYRMLHFGSLVLGYTGGDSVNTRHVQRNDSLVADTAARVVGLWLLASYQHVALAGITAWRKDSQGSELTSLAVVRSSVLARQRCVISRRADDLPRASPPFAVVSFLFCFFFCSFCCCSLLSCLDNLDSTLSFNFRYATICMLRGCWFHYGEATCARPPRPSLYCGGTVRRCTALRRGGSFVMYCCRAVVGRSGHSLLSCRVLVPLM